MAQEFIDTRMEVSFSGVRRLTAVTACPGDVLDGQALEGKQCVGDFVFS